MLAELMRNLYEAHYDKFFVALATLEQTLLIPSRLLHPHTRFYVREMRILAYGQLLESYRSLTLDSLARSFGVSIDFVDRYVHALCPESSFYVPARSAHSLSHPANSPGLSPLGGYTARSTRCTASWRRTGRRSRPRSTRR